MRFVAGEHSTQTFDTSIQAYITYPPIEGMPIKELKAFKKARLNAEASTIITLSIPVSELQKWDDKKHEWFIANGYYGLQISNDSASPELTSSFTVSKK